MKFLEKDLEEIIYTSERSKLEANGLNVKGKMFRQLRIGNYGIADLVTVERVNRLNEPTEVQKRLSITVYELKKDKVGISTFLQAVGYVRGIKHYLSTRGFKFSIEINIVLIGSNMDLSSTFAYIKEVIPVRDSFLKIYTYNYQIDGLMFQEHKDYLLNNGGF